jgi:hypothetical protein
LELSHHDTGRGFLAYLQIRLHAGQLAQRHLDS